MSTVHHQQVSGYLQINEKKVYDMVNRGIIPATKITGKWMFPKELIDKWMLDSTHNGLLRDRLIIAGSDDPFLSRIINDFSRYLGNKAVIACTNTSHPSLIQQYSSSTNWILIRAFQRELGLLFSAVDEQNWVISDFFEPKFRWDVHCSGSGSQRLLLEVLSKNGLNQDSLIYGQNWEQVAVVPDLQILKI